jgi:hypothetical protein
MPCRVGASGSRRHCSVVGLYAVSRRRRRWVWIAALVAVLALAGTAAAVWAMRDSSSAKSEADLRPFVGRIENMQSASGRREISQAIDAGLACKISNAEAARRIDSVADNRPSILQQLGSLTAPTPATDRMVTLLQQGLQHRHYRDGFLSTAKCPLPKNPSFDLALASDRRATTAKELFIARFDPLAMRLHQRGLDGRRVLTRARRGTRHPSIWRS